MDAVENEVSVATVPVEMVLGNPLVRTTAGALSFLALLDLETLATEYLLLPILRMLVGQMSAGGSIFLVNGGGRKRLTCRDLVDLKAMVSCTGLSL